jgi:hypothetical protein
MVARDKRADGLHGDVDRHNTNVIPINGNVRRRELSCSPDHDGACAFLHEVRWVPQRRRPGVVACHHDCVTKNLIVRLPGELAEGRSSFEWPPVPFAGGSLAPLLKEPRG